MFLTKNEKAFLDTISISEGTFGIGDNGYNVLVGSTKAHPLLFTSYADHPNIYNAALNSTAAGRYQLLHKYFIAYKKSLHLPDFSPPSQDAIAIQQITECHARPDVVIGNFESAIMKCRKIWASFPGAGYGQHENAMEKLKVVFVSQGGIINA